MVISPTLLQSIGLGIDIIGAFVIAAPDIPLLRDLIYSGKLSRGLDRLKSGNLTPRKTGFTQISREVEDLAGKEMPENVDRLYIGHNEIVAGGRSPWVVYAEYGSDDNRMDFLDGEFKDLEEHLRNQIDRHESKFRGLGFVMLALGFFLQIVGVVCF